MAIKMDGHAITALKLKASDGSEVTKQLTEEGTIPTPTATKQISANGTYDVKSFASAEVNVGGEAPTLITKEITENGTYNASDDSADGYSSVTVDVSGGGNAGELVLLASTTLESDEHEVTMAVSQNFADFNLWYIVAEVELSAVDWLYLKMTTGHPYKEVTTFQYSNKDTNIALHRIAFKCNGDVWTKDSGSTNIAANLITGMCFYCYTEGVNMLAGSTFRLYGGIAA